MSTLSIRKLPKELAKAILHETRVARKTKTEVVIEALEEKFLPGKKVKRNRRFREFFGKMTSAEYQAFCEAIHDFSEIEKDLWN